MKTFDQLVEELGHPEAVVFWLETLPAEEVSSFGVEFTNEQWTRAFYKAPKGSISHSICQQGREKTAITFEQFEAVLPIRGHNPKGFDELIGLMRPLAQTIREKILIYVLLPAHDEALFQEIMALDGEFSNWEFFHHHVLQHCRQTEKPSQVAAKMSAAAKSQDHFESLVRVFPLNSPEYLTGVRGLDQILTTAEAWENLRLRNHEHVRQLALGKKLVFTESPERLLQMHTDFFGHADLMGDYLAKFSKIKAGYGFWKRVRDAVGVDSQLGQMAGIKMEDMATTAAELFEIWQRGDGATKVRLAPRLKMYVQT